jgi:hypothetical protein
MLQMLTPCPLAVFSSTSEVLHNFSNMQFFPASGSLKERPPPDLYTLHESMDSSGGAGGAGGLVHDDDPVRSLPALLVVALFRVSSSIPLHILPPLTTDAHDDLLSLSILLLPLRSSPDHLSTSRWRGRRRRKRAAAALVG